MPQFLAPIINEQQFDANGDPLSGGTISVYLAGTSTPATTYNDRDGMPAHANSWPITLNTLGVNSQGSVWLVGGQAYKFVIKDANGVVLRGDLDYISGINDTTVTTDQWIFYQGDPTYVSATSFTVPGDQTQIFQPYRRLKSQNTGGLVYSTIATSAYSAPNTTVTVVNTSGVLDAGLSQVSYGLISVQDSSVAGMLLNVQVFNTPGAGTYTRTPGATKGVIKAWAGGGGSGGCPTTTGAQQAFSSGGGAGGYTEARIDLPASAPINVGAAGLAGAAGGNGGNGGNTTFNGTDVTALGGLGSVAALAVGAISSTGGTAGGAVGVGGNIVAFPGGTSPNVLSADLGFVTGQQGGASGAGNTSGYGAGASGKYAGVSTAVPQAGIVGNPGHLEVWEFA